MEVIRVLNLIKKILLLFKHQARSDQNVIGERLDGSQRIRNLYDPFSRKPFRISRSKLELFLTCNRCFYIDRRLGVGRPDIPAFTLNIAVDDLLKKEFDHYRLLQMPHPICVKDNLELVPYDHKDLKSWRNSLHEGVQYRIPDTNVIICGGIDDLWINFATQEIFVVDYKATSTKDEISLEGQWQDRLKREVEIYQWLLRKNGFTVSNTAYFVYCNGKKDMPLFDKKLHFNIDLLPYEGSDSWVEEAVNKAYRCLQTNIVPTPEKTCDYCQYWEGVRKCLEKAL